MFHINRKVSYDKRVSKQLADAFASIFVCPRTSGRLPSKSMGPLIQSMLARTLIPPPAGAAGLAAVSSFFSTFFPTNLSPERDMPGKEACPCSLLQWIHIR